MWLRRLAWGVGVVVLAALAVMVYLVSTFDPNRYKEVLVDKVRADYQRTLVLQGPITLGLWPSLHVRLSQVRLSERQASDTFASAESLELSVQAWPLLHKQLRVNRVAARDVSLRYARDAQGHSNIDDLLREAVQPAPDESSAEPVAFEVAGVELKNLAVEVDDRLKGVQGKVLLQSFDSGRLADGLKTDVRLRAQASLTQPAPLQLGVQGGLSLTPQLAQNTVLIDKLALDVEGEAAGIKQLKASLKAEALRWDGQRQAAQAQELSLEGAGQVAGLLIENARFGLQRFEYDPKARSLQLYKLAAKVEARQSGQPLTLELGWPELAVKGSQIEGSTLDGSMALAGPTALEAHFKSEAPTGGFEQFKVPALAMEFTLRMAGEGGTREIQGQAKADLNVRPQARQLALQGLGLAAKVQEPALPPMKLQAEGQAAFQSAKAPDGQAQGDWRLKGRINEDPFDTSGALTLGQGVPQVRAQAHFVALDLNRLLPAPASRAASKPVAAGPAASSPGATPVDLSALALVDGRFELSAGHLAVRQYRVDKAHLIAELAQGHLQLRTLSGAAWGGQFQAEGSAQARAPQKLALQALAQNVDVQALLKDVAGKDVLEGRGQVRLDVSTAGHTVPQLTAGLDGTASIVVRDGALKGINLAKSLRDAKARLGGQGDEVQRASQTEKTDFTEMSASFRITDGVARNQDLSAKSPFLRLGGQGTVDLVRQRVDYVVNTTITGTAKGQGGADIEALKGLTVPVKLTGPFDAMDWKIQWSGVALGSLQNTLKGRLEEQLKDKLLGKPAEPAASGASAPKPSREEQLKNKLRGLFK